MVTYVVVVVVVLHTLCFKREFASAFSATANFQWSGFWLGESGEREIGEQATNTRKLSDHSVPCWSRAVEGSLVGGRPSSLPSTDIPRSILCKTEGDLDV